MLDPALRTIADVPAAVASPGADAMLVERLEMYARQAAGAYAANTARAVRADLRVWQAWCTTAGVTALPADPAHVAVFVDSMAESKAPATIRRYLASLAFVHRAAELPDPGLAEIVRLAVRRMARAKGTRQRQAAPLGERHVQRIIGSVAGDTLIDCRDRALLLTASDLLARASELVALKVQDLARAADGSGTALIRRSKTDQEGQGSVGYLSPETLAALDAWCTRAELREGPIFRAVNRHGYVGRTLHPDTIARIFRKLATRARLDPSGVSGHSCRVGTTQDLVALGIDLPAVMQAGRWTTPTMPARYAERLVPARGAVSQLRARRRQV